MDNNIERRKGGWLLLLTLAMGYAFAFIFIEVDGHTAHSWMPAYTLFWGLYLVAYYLCLWEKVKGKRDAWYLLGAIALLFIHSAIYKAQVLTVMNFFIIPLVFMLHAVMGAFDYPEKASLGYIKRYLFGWFVFPFISIDKWFKAWATILRRGEGEDERKAAHRNILIGVLCGLPLLLLVLALLLGADQAMDLALSGLLKNLPEISFGKIILMFIFALLFYSFIYSLAWGKEPGASPSSTSTVEVKKTLLPAQSFMAAVSMLLVAYLIFAIFQFAYLTGWKGLPPDLTYSEYAVSGFSQLLWVAAINLAVFSVGLCCTRPHKALNTLLYMLLAATGVVLLSAFVRLGLYIGAYALTWKRLLSLWMMIYLAAVVVLCMLRLLGQCALVKKGMLRLCALVLVGWYVALNLVNVEGIIAQSIFAMTDRQGGVLAKDDESYLRDSLSEDARGVIERSPYREQVYYESDNGQEENRR